MKTEKDLINTVAKVYTMMKDASSTDEKLARFILTNYYGVDTFFLKKEGDYSSGLNMDSVQLFADNMTQVRKAISGEL